MEKEFLLEKTASYNYGFGGHFHLLKTGCLPNKLKIRDVNYKKWEDFFTYVLETFNWDEKNKISKENHKSDGKVWINHCLYLNEGITIYGGIEGAVLLFDQNSNTDIVDGLKNRFKALKSNTSKDIGLIRDEGGGRLEIKTFEYSLPENSLIKYLNEPTQHFHQTMKTQLGAKNGSGLYLLYGKPGTGKTSFIKDVLSQTEKKALFISPCFTENLTSPRLISLLMEYPDSILVIEDAETVLMERKADNSSAVSNLLNLTDGFLADFLNLKIICTFNTELNKIDEALLREGRLKEMHEFTKIKPERAIRIAEVLGRNINPESSMTLAEICASGQNSVGHRPKKIGFSETILDHPFN